MAEGRLKYATGIDNSQLSKDAQQSKAILHSIGDSAAKEGERIDNSFKKIGGAIAAAFTTQQLASFAQQVVKVRGEIQALEVSFTTLLGSKDKATALFKELKDFAVKTPLMLSDLSKAAQTLLSFNVDADKVMPTLRAIGDISMGDSQKLQSLTLAFSQMSSTGKLMGQDLLQMINAGFNPLTVISEKTGKSIGELKDEMSKGAISADLVAKAFMAATQEGGKFYRMLESQSNTIQGSISNLQGAWDDLLNTIGTESEGIINGTIQVIADLVKNYEKVGKVIAELIATYGAYKAAVIALTTIENMRYQATLAQMAGYTKLGVVVDILRKKQEALNIIMAKNPYALAAAAIAALAFGVYKLVTAETEAEKELKAVNKRLEEQREELSKVYESGDMMVDMQKNVIESTAEEKTKIKDLTDIIHSNAVSVEGRKKAIADLQSVVPNYHAELDAEGRLHKENTQAVNEYIDSLNRLAMAEAIRAKKEEISKGIVEATIAMDTSAIDRAGAVSNINTKQQELNKARQRAKSSNTTFATSAGAYYATPSVRAEETALALAEAQLQEIDNSIEINKKKIAEFKRQNEQLDELAKQYSSELQKLNNQNGDWKTGSGTTGVDKNADKEAQKLRDETAKRLYEIERKKKELLQAEKDAEFEIQQAKIDAQQDGYNKQTEQNLLNFERRKEAIAREEAELVEQLRDKMGLEYQQQNPKATEADILSFKSGISASNLSESQKNQIREKYRINGDILVEENQKALDAVIESYGSFEQKLQALRDKWGTIINTLPAEFKEEAKKQMNEELANYIINNSQMTSAITDLFDDMTERSVSDLRKIANSAQSLYNVLKNGKWDDSIGQAFNITKEQYDAIRQSPDELEKIRKAIDDINASADKNDNVLGQMSKGLKEVLSAGDNTTKLQKGLSLIGDAISKTTAAADFLSGAFSSIAEATDNEALQGIADGLNVATDAMNSAIKGAETGAMFGPIGAAAGAAIGLVTSLYQSISKLHDEAIQRRIEELRKQIEGLTEVYSDLSDAVSDALGKNKVSYIQEQNRNLEKQNELIREQIREEQSKKKSDEDQIEQYRQQIKENEKLIQENKEAAKDAIFGSDIQAAISDFSSAMANAWADNMTSATSAKEYVKNMMQSVVQESVKAYLQAQGSIDKIRESIASAMADDIITDDEKQRIEEFAQQVAEDVNKKYSWAENLFSTESERTASNKGISGASQEAVDELNGRMTAVQGHTYSISENTKLLLANTYAILQSVLNIESNTNRLEVMEAGVKDIKSTLNNIAINGVKVK